jgi:GNAT superfamily N-acetyltransferase
MLERPDGPVVTQQGRTVTIRPLVAADAGLLVDLFQRISPESRRLRFFTSMSGVPDDRVRRHAARLAAIDPRTDVALVALVEEAGQPHAVGVGRIMGLNDPQAAEVALLVRDDYQREGVGTLLAARLLQEAQARGLTQLTAIYLPENTGIERLLRKWNLPTTRETRQGYTISVFDLRAA